jgi:hypothetical protein
VPDDHWSEQVAAFTRSAFRHTATREELIAYCRAPGRAQDPRHRAFTVFARITDNALGRNPSLLPVGNLPRTGSGIWPSIGPWTRMRWQLRTQGRG